MVVTLSPSYQLKFSRHAISFDRWKRYDPSYFTSHTLANVTHRLITMTRLGPSTVLAINQTAGTTNRPDSRSNFASGRRIVTVSSGDRSSNATMIPLARAETRWRTAGERENLAVPYAKHRALRYARIGTPEKLFCFESRWCSSYGFVLLFKRNSKDLMGGWLFAALW